ncbi:MAG: hypothetical protein R3202_02470 [Candidatus Competibacterales bacterium]|nr:hypothetical protein [Candidatus Competibacterales bacterium]
MARLASGGWLLLPAVALAGPADDATEVADRPPRPSLELLEFLGEWQTGDGRWIDPYRLAVPTRETLTDETDRAADPVAGGQR